MLGSASSAVKVIEGAGVRFHASGDEVPDEVPGVEASHEDGGISGSLEELDPLKLPGSEPGQRRPRRPRSVVHHHTHDTADSIGVQGTNLAFDSGRIRRQEGLPTQDGDELGATLGAPPQNRHLSVDPPLDRRIGNELKVVWSLFPE